MKLPVEIQVLGTAYTMVAIAHGRVLARAVLNQFGWHVLLSPDPRMRARFTSTPSRHHAARLLYGLALSKATPALAAPG